MLGAVGALVVAGTVLAAPALALEDPRRPVAEVTHGPSCGPGVIRVQVANGSQPHSVALVFDGTVVQDTADLGPAERVELGSADVAWGTTVHVAVAVTDAAGAVQVPLDFGTYTRPSKEDCDALDLPPEPSPPVGTQDTVAPAFGGSGSAPAPGGMGSGPQTVPVGDHSPVTGAVAAAPVAPGGVVTVRGSGFAPGEPVDVTLDGADAPLTTVVAAADGTVEAVVQIPRGADLGSVTVQLVGRTSSAMSGLDLQVAARQQVLTESGGHVPALAAGAALLVASVGLGAAAARRPRTVPAPAYAWRR
jgi:hypothetical protein